MLHRLKTLIGQRNPLRLLWHKAKAFAAAARYGFPAKRLTVIGITGTDGKTTTTGMVAHILHVAGISVGAASTAFMQIKDRKKDNATHLTSVSPFSLQKFLRTLVREGCTHAVIEMSSHGLVQQRVAYTYPAVAAITNTALEHLDYHGTMEQYRRDKGIMFEMLGGKGTKVLNRQDETYALYTKIPSARTLVYGASGEDLSVTDCKAQAGTTTALLTEKNGATHDLHLRIPGTFNLQNAQCAIACAWAVGVPVADAVSALASFNGIPGRMERIDEGRPFSVFVDFAVSPQAYEKTLETLRGIVEGGTGRTWVLCSSCGNRMKEKRPQIGRICSTLADVVVVTEDETYGEDPHAVFEEVWAGIDQTACEAHKIFDRREAITYIINNAKPGDAVAICGMGPFTTFTKLEGRIPWDERQIVRDILKAR